MDTFIPASLRRHRNKRKLTLDRLSAKVSMSPQHLSEIESGKRDPRLSSIERMAEAMGLTVLLVPETMAPEIRRYIDTQGRAYTTPSGKTAAAPEPNGPDHAAQET